MRGGSAANAAECAAALAAKAHGSSSSSAPAGAAVETKVVGTLQALYQIVDSYTREKFPMIDVVPQTAATFQLQQQQLQQIQQQQQAAAAAGGEGDDVRESSNINQLFAADSFLASSLVRRVEEAEWQRKGKLLLNNKPSRLEWVECRASAGLKGRRPPLASVTAGFNGAPLRIAIAIVGAEGKPLAKQTAVSRGPHSFRCSGVAPSPRDASLMLTPLICDVPACFCRFHWCQGATVSMVARHRESGQEWTQKVSAETRPEVTRHGQYVFSLLPPDDDAVASEAAVGASVHESTGQGCFSLAGTYEYRWRCVELALPTKEFTVTVRPSCSKLLPRACEKCQANDCATASKP